MAACMRITTDYKEGLQLLEKCEPVGVKHHLTLQLSRLHHLRGNLYFSLGNIDGCHKEHQRALEYAREVVSAEDEARALGGLGDAEYARGRMKSAVEALRMCVERCRKHGFGRIEVANLSQMVNSQVHLGNYSCARALKDSLEAVQAASRVSHDRAQMNALGGVCNVAFELGDAVLMETSSQHGLALAQKLKARNWVPLWRMHSALVFYLRGERHRACEELERGVQTESAHSFIGPWVFGCLSMISTDSPARARALREGKRLLDKGSMGSNHLNYYRFAMEGCLDAEEWSEVDRYAQALEDFTGAEPLPMSNFFIARGRVLAAFGRGIRDEATMDEIRRLLDEAERLELKVATPALEDALAST